MISNIKNFKLCGSVVLSLFITFFAGAQESEVEYEVNNFHDTILELYEEEMALQEERYTDFLREKLENSILDMNDYYGYSISKWQEINRDE
jgi:hypothetical protein